MNEGMGPLSLSEFNVRRATDAEVNAIENVILEWTEEQWPTWKPARARTILQILKNDDHVLLVCERDNAIVGAMHLIFYDDIVSGSLNCHLNFLLVKKSRRKKGIGRKLLDAAIDTAKKRGVNEIHVDTMFENAIKFYKRHGFEDDGVWLELSLRKQGVPQSRHNETSQKTN